MAPYGFLWCFAPNDLALWERTFSKVIDDIMSRLDTSGLTSLDLSRLAVNR
ncbi:hypothetical protein [Aporhodopirellula aestuarii]|uniref:Uncharacterized protein n=1 Tax=Aporhodopirellula aestuarii TaxID=2950107 RepID=A0ABT0TWZ5_9BACT|nr:hypothetical protein [Aporhodopirellula aestuarii]MCM2369070.1 hypothetical protein [Aporhodopirellula aestuarii]